MTRKTAARFPFSLRGYRRDSVDALISRVERTLHGDAGPDEVRASEVPLARLPRSVRGYRESSVEEYLGEAAQRLRRLTKSARGGPPSITGVMTHPQLRAPFGAPNERRFPVVKRGKVYDSLLVDMFVADVHNWVGNALTSRMVRDVRFLEHRDRPGYQQEAVRAWLRALEAYLLAKGW